jgi:hypothetical protein
LGGSQRGAGLRQRLPLCFQLCLLIAQPLQLASDIGPALFQAALVSETTRHRATQALQRRRMVDQRLETTSDRQQPRTSLAHQSATICERPCFSLLRVFLHTLQPLARLLVLS